MSKISMEAQIQSNDINNNLKAQVRNLANEYNTHTDVRNQQAEVMHKYDYYMTLQNKKLQEQLNKLSEIESEIATRDALVRDNSYSFQKKDKKIHVIKVFFLVLMYLVFIIISFLGKKISLTFLLTNILIVIVIYFLYVA